MAYARLEPFGSEADDTRLAQLLALIANVNRDPKKRPRPWSPEDFLPKRGPRLKPDPASLRPRIDAAMAAFGGMRDQRRTDPTAVRPTTTAAASAATPHIANDRTRATSIPLPLAPTDAA